MKKEPMPETSLEAFNALTDEKIDTDHKSIFKALKELGSANYDQISVKLNWLDKNSVSRRLKEMEKDNLVYKTGDKSLTSRNRNAFVWKVVLNGEKSIEPEKLLPGKSIGEFAANLTNQGSLFHEK